MICKKIEKAIESVAMPVIGAASGAFIARVSDSLGGQAFTPENDIKFGAVMGFIGGLALAADSLLTVKD